MWTMSGYVISLPTNPHSLSSSLSLCSYTIVKINLIWLADKKYGVLTCQTRFFTVAQDKTLSDTEHNNSAVHSKSIPMWLQSCSSVYSRNTITSLLQKGGRETATVLKTNGALWPLPLHVQWSLAQHNVYTDTYSTCQKQIITLKAHFKFSNIIQVYCVLSCATYVWDFPVKYTCKVFQCNTCLRDVSCENRQWMAPARDHIQRQALVSVTLNLLVPLPKC